MRRDASGAFWTVCRCGDALAPAGENWRGYAARSTAAGDELGAGLVVHQKLEARRYACPRCGVLHAVDICRKDDPDPYDIQLDLAGLGQR